jgi:uncharacterized protein YdhG (YjbR/CyaY superfamily)
MRTRFATVDEYIDSFEPAMRATLARLREIFRECLPAAVESTSYQLAAYNQERLWLYFGGFTKHYSIFGFGTDSIRAAYAAELAGLLQSKGTIRFPSDRPIPEDLIRRLIAARVAEHRV